MSDPILTVSGLHAGYGATEILRGIDLTVGEGEIVAVLGSNGAGKSTLNRTLSGVLRAWRGRVRFENTPIERERPASIVARGLIHVPEGRRIFPNMTVRENLDLGAYRRGRGHRLDNRARVFEIFPRLAERQAQRAGTLSGGEQQMLAIGRALMSRPRVLLLDEPSMGLAPMIVAQIFRILRDIRAAGASLLLVEQNAAQALGLADRAYVLETGEIVMSGPASDLLADDRVRDAYLGTGAR
jgi:branched-chain amino acid transport system ATP-binding protein